MAAKIFLDLPGGLKMPVLGIGTWQAKEPAELESALETALENGYRHIDTAYAYDNEKVIGKVLNKWFKAGKLKRDDVFVTTKLPAQGVHPDRVELFIKKSLESLQLDYVDLYLIHFPLGLQCDESTGQIKVHDKKILYEGRTDQAALWKKMEEQVDAGRTKTIGLSNYNVSQIETVLKSARIKPANLQIELNVYLQQRELVNFCKKNGISVVAYSPLACPGYNKFLKNFDREEIPLPDILGDPVIKKIAQKHSKTPAQIALRFLVQNGIAAIPKSVTPKRLIENISIFDFSLDENDITELNNLEVGEKARIITWDVLGGVKEHPDYPFPR